MCWLSRILGISGQDKPSPSNIIQETGILADNYSAKVIIDLRQNNIGMVKQPKVWMPPIPDSNSMDSSFDYGHNNILISGADNFDQIKLINFLTVGDIAVYQVAGMTPIIHRIVEIGKDGDGRYFRFQGDNNAVKDPHKVRDSEILWLSIGTIY